MAHTRRRQPLGHCGACARRLRVGGYLMCPHGCGERLCATPRRCLTAHSPYNCPVYQAEHGVEEAS
ncbi:hypothetical protein GCM10011583_57710 [Streptomyces camponoticapitis]|uniref:Uncharacterized protein n=1 Tax=Streptomyces camponoticapitis TaxID=1616125 RepID=A0ABQ2ENV2_9ACTN|nr:hypothetical protein GCM10011583_57710 [Streptomyces camponoticapitis]